MQQLVAEVEEAKAAERELLQNDSYDGGYSLRVEKVGSRYEVHVSSTTANSTRILHWGVDEWATPPQAAWPPGSRREGNAVQTPFSGHSLSFTFDEDWAPARMCFVMKMADTERGGDVWVNNNGVGYGALLKPPGMDSVFDRVLSCEGGSEHWSLFQRLALVNEVLDAADAAGPTGMGFVFAWLRLSHQRRLDWYRKANYQPKDQSHMQKVVAQRLTHKAFASKHPLNRQMARMALAGLPRGGGDGDAIRHGILDIMRSNGIKEGHRPGLDEPFLEQWHQKLHTNSGPDDIAICEAYLAFLHSGNHDDYWRVLWDSGRVTREQLETMSKPLKAWPMHLPHLINPFKHYLWTLKTVHSGANLDTALEMSKGLLDEDLRWNLFDLKDHRDEWWVPGKVVELREKLAPYWKCEGASRDVMLLDIALEELLRRRVESQQLQNLQGDDLVALVDLLLRNARVNETSAALQQCAGLWSRVIGEQRWGPEWCRRALAALSATQHALARYGDDVYAVVQGPAEAFGAACGIEAVHITNFGEEVVRSQAVFLLSLLSQHLEPKLRATAGLGHWQVVSQAAARGEVVVVGELSEVQGKRFSRPTVLLAERVGGEEDIPVGVQAVLTRSATDVLSHIAIRARCQGVLLATCFDGATWGAVGQLAGQFAVLDVTPSGEVHATIADAQQAALLHSADVSALAPLRLAAPRPGNGEWVLPMDQFAEGRVGAKSGNLAALRSALPQWIHVPSSVALPFGAFERVLGDSANADTAAALSRLEGELAAAADKSDDSAGVPPQLEAIRKLIGSRLKAPEALRSELSGAAASAGLIPSASAWAGDGAAWRSAWGAVCRVWASKWNDRAWLSRRLRAVPEQDLVMAVLLQQIVPAQYAFVLHTADPVSGARDSVVGELVLGLGESLVGNHPGSALSFSAAHGAAPEVCGYPSKPFGLFSAGGTRQGVLIARSDANGEDLEGFAGAGLYDSVPFPPSQERALDYGAEPLLWDASFRSQLLAELVGVGRAVEAAAGGAPQDIEGCWCEGKFTVVQARPQQL